jgi:hypothetical protein
MPLRMEKMIFNLSLTSKIQIGITEKRLSREAVVSPITQKGE